MESLWKIVSSQGLGMIQLRVKRYFVIVFVLGIWLHTFSILRKLRQKAWYSIDKVSFTKRLETTDCTQ